MTDGSSDLTENAAPDDPVSAVDHLTLPPWNHVTVADLEDLDVEQPIAGSDAADCAELASLYQTAAYPDRDAEPPDSPSLRVFALTGGALNMYFKPAERNEPFGAYIVWADGRRSPVTSDFIDHIDVLDRIATKITNPAIKARLADVCWLLDMKRWASGVAAVSAYVEVVRGVDQGLLRYRVQREWRGLGAR